MTILLLSLLACTPSDEAPSDSEAADADTDTDTDTDCDERDLIYVAGVRDSSGNCAGCSSPVEISGAVQNRCENEVTLQTSSGCLVASAVVRVQGGADVHTQTASCDAAAKTWTFAPNQSIPETIIPSLSLGVGTYDVTVTFNDARPNEAAKLFAIE